MRARYEKKVRPGINDRLRIQEKVSSEKGIRIKVEPEGGDDLVQRITRLKHADFQIVVGKTTGAQIKKVIGAIAHNDLVCSEAVQLEMHSLNLFERELG